MCRCTLYNIKYVIFMYEPLDIVDKYVMENIIF